MNTQEIKKLRRRMFWRRVSDRALGFLRLQWLKLQVHIQDDEFSPSLDIDINYACTLSPAKLRRYYEHIAHLREIAHQRDLALTG